MTTASGHIPTRIAHDAHEEQTVRATQRALAQQPGLYEILSGSPPTPASNGFYTADGTFVPYCVCDVDPCDGDAPCGP